MPSNWTADDCQAVVESLKKEYFFVRRRTVWVGGVLLAALGIGAFVTAYTALQVATTEISKVKAQVEQGERERASLVEVTKRLEFSKAIFAKLTTKEGTLGEGSDQLLLEVSGKAGLFFLTLQADGEPEKVQSRVLQVVHRLEGKGTGQLEVSVLDAGSSPIPGDFGYSTYVVPVVGAGPRYRIMVNINYNGRKPAPNVRYTIRGLAE